MEHANPLLATLTISFIVLVIISLYRARRGYTPYVRPIPGVTAMEEAVGRATELGRPIVFAMGTTDIRDIITHATLAVMKHVARLAARMQTRFMAMVVKPDVYPLVEVVTREAYREEGADDVFNAKEQVLFLSDNTIVYAMSVARTISEEPAGCAMFFGRCDFTSLLMTEPGANAGVLQIAGDPQLAQIPFFVCTCDYVIIGEEFFAASAYVSEAPAVRGSLVSQDMIKAILVGMLVLGLVTVMLGQFGIGWAEAFAARLQAMSTSGS